MSLRQVRINPSLSSTMPVTASPAHTDQSFPEPHELLRGDALPATAPSEIAEPNVVTFTPASGRSRRTRSNHMGPSCHQCPNNSVS